MKIVIKGLNKNIDILEEEQLDERLNSELGEEWNLQFGVSLTPTEGKNVHVIR